MPLSGFNGLYVKIIDSTRYYFVGSTYGLSGCADGLSNAVGVIVKYDPSDLCSSFPTNLDSFTGIASHMSTTDFEQVLTTFSYINTTTERDTVSSLNLLSTKTFGPSCCKYQITPHSMTRRQYIIDTPQISINFFDFTLNETCDDYSFTYTAKMSTGASLPSYIQMDSADA